MYACASGDTNLGRVAVLEERVQGIELLQLVPLIKWLASRQIRLQTSCKDIPQLGIRAEDTLRPTRKHSFVVLAHDLLRNLVSSYLETRNRSGYLHF